MLALLLLFVLIGWQIASDRWAPYTARVAGQVVVVVVKDGDVVEAGATLAQLDPRAFELAVRQAEAGLSRALQSTRVSATGIVAAQAGVTAARSERENVQANSARTLELVARAFLSAVKSDEARAALRGVDAPLQRAEAELDRAMISTGSGGVANPEVRAAQLQLERAQLDQHFATLRAPTHGVVTNLRLAIGQYVAPGMAAMTFIDARGAWIATGLLQARAWLSYLY